MTSQDLDAIDRRLAAALQEDCRLSTAALADRAGLSPSACHRRIKLLEDKGVIDHYAAVLNGEAIGYAMEFIVEVTLKSQADKTMSAFEQAVAAAPEILECVLMSGDNDYLMRIAARDAKDYERIHRDVLAPAPGVDRIKSSLALRIVKPRKGYPVAVGLS